MAGDFVIASDSTSHAQVIAAAGKESTLADDASYQKWTEEAGTDGIAGFYLSKQAPEVFADFIDDQLSGIQEEMGSSSEEFELPSDKEYLATLPKNMSPAEREQALEQLQEMRKQMDKSSAGSARDRGHRQGDPQAVQGLHRRGRHRSASPTTAWSWPWPAAG